MDSMFLLNQPKWDVLENEGLLQRRVFRALDVFFLVSRHLGFDVH